MNWVTNQTTDSCNVLKMVSIAGECEKFEALSITASVADFESVSMKEETSSQGTGWLVRMYCAFVNLHF